MPALQPYIIEPIWEQFSALLPERQEVHPLGCHRPRIADRVVFEKLVQVLVFGSVPTAEDSRPGECSATTLCAVGRREEWIEAGTMEELREVAFWRPTTGSSVYDRTIWPSIVLHHERSSLRWREGGQKPGRAGEAGDQALRGGGRMPMGHPSGDDRGSGQNRHDSPTAAGPERR